ncbi:PREDICTED: uncharacterized protein LOC109219347 [Nicotiana attenuata]|uniref:uncharacterized protein LOC109219347 n=1 Tax=Nicotiana attenuata TaxID=49451 RepID=UPI0009055C0C|nr:PREDICTED: uncharacterized protein LOC109219347 [Nicotiana attenuata]
MTNPQDNPRTPPQPTPSDSSTSPPPSTTPKHRLRRVKMLARKTVASGALSKKLNEKLKASQVQDFESNSDSESYKSASEGEGPGSSDLEKDVELPEVGRNGGKKKSAKEKEREENVEESGKKSGGSGSGKAAERLVNLSSQGDEPGSSVEETLADLLKKALAESKKKRMDKGKGKVAESSEAVEVEEMEQRTRSAVKSKQVRIFEDEEWSGEEEKGESEDEQDKLAMFGKRKYLKGRLLKDLMEPGMLIEAQNNAIEEIRKMKALGVFMETPDSSSSQSTEVAHLTKENVDLRKQVEDLKERLLNEQVSVNARMDILLRTLASSFVPPPSSAT